MTGTNDPTPIQLSEDEIKRFREMESENATLRQAAEAAQAEAKQAAERIAAIESENRRRAFTEQAAGWHGETSTHVSFMESLPSDELRQQYAAMETSHAVALHEALTQANAFRAVGITSFAEDSAMGQLEAVAKSIRASEPALTEAQAKARAIKNNPQLYAEYQREAIAR